MNSHKSKQTGAALIVALVAMIVLTVLGIATMGDVMDQSSVVRNEQFRQRVFYAAISELNVQIDSVNRNSQSASDPIIDDLLNTSVNGTGLVLPINAEVTTPPIFTNPSDVSLSQVSIDGDRIDHFGCPGESIGKVKVLAGNINATARLGDGRGSILSDQSQRYVYCWP